MVKKFAIVLNLPPNAIYYPGSVVSGALILETHEPKSYKSVKIALIGSSRVSWSVSAPGYPSPTVISYSAKEEYVSEKIVLWTQRWATSDHTTSAFGCSCTPDHSFPAGKHKFAFRFPALPQGIPPTFNSQFRSTGYVRYYVEGRIVRSFLHDDKVVERDICVTKTVDINVSRLLTPAEVETEGTACCLCCISPPITMTVHLPRTGFCIGEVVPVRVTLNNRSSRMITLRAELVRKVVYKAQRDSTMFFDKHYSAREAQKHIYHSEKVLCGVTSENRMPAQSSTTWDPGELAVSRGTPSMSTPKGSINLTYSLQVIAVLPWSTDLVIKVPLVIGNVPLHQVAAPCLNATGVDTAC